VELQIPLGLRVELHIPLGLRVELQIPFGLRVELHIPLGLRVELHIPLGLRIVSALGHDRALPISFRFFVYQSSYGVIHQEEALN
jgi:hypothetical protein